MNSLRTGSVNGDPQRWFFRIVLWTCIAVGANLTGADLLMAQQPAVRRADSRRRETDQPLPLPELLPAEASQRLLGLVDLEEMAIDANPAVIRASALVGAARGNMIQVGLLPNPTVGYEGQQLGSGGRAEQHGVLFSQEIVRGGKLRLNRAVARQQLARAQQELSVARRRVLTDVRIGFYQV